MFLFHFSEGRGTNSPFPEWAWSVTIRPAYRLQVWRKSFPPPLCQFLQCPLLSLPCAVQLPRHTVALRQEGGLYCRSAGVRQSSMIQLPEEEAIRFNHSGARSSMLCLPGPQLVTNEPLGPTGVQKTKRLLNTTE